MTQPSLDAFLQSVANIKVLRMGGASAGMFGTSGVDHDMIHDLKTRAAQFAQAYNSGNLAVAAKAAGHIEAQLRTLQVTNVLSEKESEKLITSPHLLTDAKT